MGHRPAVSLAGKMEEREREGRRLLGEEEVAKREKEREERLERGTTAGKREWGVVTSVRRKIGEERERAGGLERGGRREGMFRFWSFGVERIRELITTIRLDSDEGLGFDLGFIN